MDLNNLRQVAMACNFFAAERNGKFPLHLGELFDPEITIFRDPAEATSIFLRHRTLSEAGAINDIMKWTDWVYLPGHSDDSPPDALLLFLPPGHHFINKEPVALAVSVDGTQKTLGLEEFVRNLNKTLKELSANKPEAGNGVEAPGKVDHP